MNRTQQRSHAHPAALAAAFLAGVIVALGWGAFAAPEFEMLLGQTKFHAREDGTWWQSGPSAVTNNSFISSSYLLGLKWSGEHFGFRAGYTRLGDYSGRNVASVLDEDAEHVVTADTCDPSSAHDCPAQYNGQGRAQGIYLGPTVEYKRGPLSGLIEFGALFFRSTYDVTVCRPYDNAVVPKGQCYDYNHATGDHYTWYWGAQAGYRMFRHADAVLLYREYWNVYQQGRAMGGDVGLTGGRARQILAGVSIPF